MSNTELKWILAIGAPLLAWYVAVMFNRLPGNPDRIMLCLSAVMIYTLSRMRAEGRAERQKRDQVLRNRAERMRRR